MQTAEQTVQSLVDVENTLDGIWSTVRSDDVAHAVHDAMEDVRRAIRFARTEWHRSDTTYTSEQDALDDLIAGRIDGVTYKQAVNSLQVR